MATHLRSLSSPEGHRTQAAGPTADAQRHLLDFVQWCFLAGPSGAIRSLAKRLPLVSHLDERRHLRPHLGAAAGPTEGGGAGGFGHLVYRPHKCQGLPSRSGSEKGGCEALGRSRGGFSTKLHLVCDGLGNPLAALLTPGQQHEGTVCTELLASVRVRTRAGGGRPRSRPKVVVADRGYDAGAFRRYLRRRGIRCVIPEKRIPAGKRRRRRGRPPTFCRTTYCQRNMVERLVGWLKEHRRIATRFEKLGSSYMAMVKLSFVRRYFRALERSSRSTWPYPRKPDASVEPVAQPPAHEGQKPQDDRRRLDHDLGVLVLGEEHRRVDQRRWILRGKALYPAGGRQAVEGPGEFLEPRGGPVPVHGRDVLVVLVLDGVRRPFGDGERFADPNLVPATVQEHVRRAGGHPVGLLLMRMDVDRRTTAVGPHGAF